MNACLRAIDQNCDDRITDISREKFSLMLYAMMRHLFPAHNSKQL